MKLHMNMCHVPSLRMPNSIFISIERDIPCQICGCDCECVSVCLNGENDVKTTIDKISFEFVELICLFIKYINTNQTNEFV